MADELEKKKYVGTGVVLKALKSIEALKGVVTPYDVVEEARSVTHPLHEGFEWDDAVGGEKYRLMQARLMINQIRVEFQGERREAYLNVVTTVKSVPTRGYVSIERVMSDQDMHKQVVAQALHELDYWQHKYDSLSELQGVIDTSRVEEAKNSL